MIMISSTYCAAHSMKLLIFDEKINR